MTASNNSIAWLFLVPIGIFLLIALVMNIFVIPFANSPINFTYYANDSARFSSDIFAHLLFTGGNAFTGLNVTFNIPGVSLITGPINLVPLMTIVNPIAWVTNILPNEVTVWFDNQIDYFFLLPTALLYPLFVLGTLSFLLGIALLIASFIP